MFFTVVLIFACELASTLVTAIAESTDPVTAYEQSNVTTDLNGATINGGTLDYSMYPFSEKRNVEIISFIEFCYSYDSSRQGDYGLYIYVYNPRGKDWTKNEQLNKIQLRYGGNASAPFNKYNLKYLNQSEEPGREGLFYKFKIALSPSERTDVLQTVSNTERVYEIGEIELYDSGTNANTYNVANTYKYTGYATGYGSASATSDTLNCVSHGLTTLTLDVHPVQYRPDGSNGKNEYTQDMLHSVYFSIPNKILNEYGGLSAVHATWLNARTSPIFVTGNEEVYNALYSCVHGLNGLPNNLDYCWAARARHSSIAGGGWSGDLYYGDTPNIWNHGMGDSDKSKFINSLHYLFLAEDGKADTYRLSGTVLHEYMKSYTGGILGGLTDIVGQYRRALFESYDKEHTDVTINADDTYSLTSEKITQHWWEKLFGMHGSQVESSTKYNNIEAIYAVDDSDFKSDIAATCARLYIDESNYKEFKSFFTKATLKQETVFLFRYYQSEYESREVTQFKYQKILFDERADLIKLDTNAYVAQETVTLDFDIIDVTCSKGNVDTVIPVIMSPIEIIPDVTPPLITEPESDFWDKLKRAAIIAAIIAGAVISIEILVMLIKALTPQQNETKKE